MCVGYTCLPSAWLEHFMIPRQAIPRNVACVKPAEAFGVCNKKARTMMPFLAGSRQVASYNGHDADWPLHCLRAGRYYTSCIRAISRLLPQGILISKTTHDHLSWLLRQYGRVLASCSQRGPGFVLGLEQSHHRNVQDVQLVMQSDLFLQRLASSSRRSSSSIPPTTARH